MIFFIVFAGWIISLCIHEFSHAFVAYLGGDSSVHQKGYLTLNPINYIHPVYSILMPMIFLVMGGLGLPGGAVHIEHNRLRSKTWDSAVSLFGPLSNLFLAVILAAILKFAPTDAKGIWPSVAFLGALQVSAVVLNFLPVPPLDGYGILSPYMKPKLRYKLDQMGQWSIWILFLALGFLPQVNEFFWRAVWFICERLGVSPQLAWEGYEQFRSVMQLLPRQF